VAVTRLEAEGRAWVELVSAEESSYHTSECTGVVAVVRGEGVYTRGLGTSECSGLYWLAGPL